VSTTRAGVLQFCATADAAPSAPGAYILQVDIAENVLVTIAGRSPTELTAGRYLYCGSANGPGGLRARLARHMRHGKSAHWHIDQLTERGIIIGSWIVPNGLQCELVAMLNPLPMPIPGFGSSDCSRCRSHLLYRPTGVSVPLTGFNEPHLDLDQQFSAGPSI
jgi:histidyl-tRNA synthetase